MPAIDSELNTKPCGNQSLSIDRTNINSLADESISSKKSSISTPFITTNKTTESSLNATNSDVNTNSSLSSSAIPTVTESKSMNDRKCLHHNQSYYVNRIPVYYLSRGNNSQLIDTVLTELGWKRTSDRHADYTLRWTENGVQINYTAFREGEQIVNHIPNCGILTNKLGLLTSLRDFERRYQNQHGRPPVLNMDEFLPKTFIIDDPKERELFFSSNESKESNIWICKPIGLNQGKGIFLVRDLEIFMTHLERRDEEARAQPTGLPPRIIQKYISYPLLLDERKFDIRCYMLIASTVPYLVFYHPGYIRRSTKPYSLDDTNLITHLTNQFVQKKDPDYYQMKNNTVWNLDQLNEYINKNYRETKNLPTNWAKSVLQWRIQRIIYHVFTAVKHRLASRIGFFELLGLDFMLDENMKVWLLEINSNPALQTHCDVLKQLLPEIVRDSLHISIECFEKNRLQKPLLPLQGLANLSHILGNQKASNRCMRFSLDETSSNNKVGGDLGLPYGWTLIYNESMSAFRARWPSSQSNSLRGWIAPRYKPQIHTSVQSDKANNQNQTQNTTTNNTSELVGTSKLPMQAFGSTAPQRESASLMTVIPNSMNIPISGPCTQEMINFPNIQTSRLSLPDCRPFELSLRRYPNNVKVNITNKSNTKTTSNQLYVSKPRKIITCQDVLNNQTESSNLIVLPVPNSCRLQTNHVTNVSNVINLQDHPENKQETNNKSLNSSLRRACSTHRESVQMSTIHLITNPTKANSSKSDSSKISNRIPYWSEHKLYGQKLKTSKHIKQTNVIDRGS